jgi:hypothetical protein
MNIGVFIIKQYTMKFTITEEEKKSIRGMYLLEQETSGTTPNNDVPTISSISIMNNMLTPNGADRESVSVSGVLGVVNCEPTPETKGEYTVNNRLYDKELVNQAIGSDTKICVYSLSPGDTKLNEVHKEQQTNDLLIRFVFPKDKIPNLSDETMFGIFIEKGGQRLQYDGKNIATKCKGFMLV